MKLSRVVGWHDSQLLSSPSVFDTPPPSPFPSTDKEPEQTGRLISPVTLPKLTAAQLQALQMAKKYCQDTTAKHVGPLPPSLSSSLTVCPHTHTHTACTRTHTHTHTHVYSQQQQKQTEQQVVQMHALQEAANKQRALLLMSR